MLDRDFWKKYFSTYDILNIVIPYVELLDRLKAELGVSPGDLILDLGAGTGNLSIPLQELGASVTALDYSKEGLEILRQKNSGIAIVQYDLSRPLLFESNYFDKVVSNNVLYAVAPVHRLSVMKEVYRVLKPGGVVVISNVVKGWDPLKIYMEHIRLEKKRIGIFKLCGRMASMLMPTARMFIYNAKIKRSEGTVPPLTALEQKQLLIDSGFTDVSDGEKIYAGQAIFHKARK